jgi:hypothetical protein
MKLINPDLVSMTGSVTRTGTATYYDSSGLLKTTSSEGLRFGYNPSTLEFVGLIVEGASTNLFTYSESFNNAAWTKTGLNTISADSGTDPRGTTTAEKIVPNTSSTQKQLQQQINASASSGETYSLSIYAKADGYSWIRLAFSGADSSYAFFDLSTGLVGTSSGVTKAVVEKLPNGYYRLCIVKTLASSGALQGNVYLQSTDNQTSSWSGDGTKAIVLYGAQAELQPLMTSYIPTTAAAVTRAAEVITGSGVIYTDLTNSYAEWASGTTYSIGQIVSVGTYNGSNTVTISDTTTGTYKSLTNSNTNNNPLTSPSNWVRIGPTNQFAMFDTVISSQSQATTEFTICIKAGSLDSIAVLNALGASVSVAVSDADKSNQFLGNVLFNNTRYLTGGQSQDWYSYFFYDPDTQLTQAVYLDITAANNNIITVRVKGTGTVKAGILVEGNLKEIGSTQYGVTAGIIDYSKKETDEFGNTRITIRNYSKRMNAKVHLTNPNVNRVQRLLYNIRSSPVLWIGSEVTEFEEPLVVYGYYKSFDTEIAYPTHSLCNLEIEGLI